MADKEPIPEQEELQEEEVEEEDEENIYDSLVSISQSYNNICEIDGALLSKQDQRKLDKMKRKLFDAMVFYVDCIPDLTDEP